MMMVIFSYFVKQLELISRRKKYISLDMHLQTTVQSGFYSKYTVIYCVFFSERIG